MRKNARFLNYYTIISYVVLLTAAALLIQLLSNLFVDAVPNSLDRIGLGLAESGFSVSVIAVSILTVFANLSEKRYFGVVAGEYLKLKKGKFIPGFYDNFVIIILTGAMQFMALGINAPFAALLLFIEIVALLILQITWGIDIAFFHYDIRDKIRSYLTEELHDNIDVLSDETSTPLAKENAANTIVSRIDQLFLHTKRASLLQERMELVDNLGIFVNVFKMLLSPCCHVVWRNFEIRLDAILSSLIKDNDQRTYALTTLRRVLDIVIEHMNKSTNTNEIVKHCDFDTSRNAVYQYVSQGDPASLAEVFEHQLFFKFAVVKIYGIQNEQRKIARYRFFAKQFVKNVFLSQFTDDLMEMIESSIDKLVPLGFYGGVIQESGYYICTLIEALHEEEIVIGPLQNALLEKYFSCEINRKNGNSTDALIKMQTSIAMFLLIEKDTLGIEELPMFDLTEAEIEYTRRIARLIGKDDETVEGIGRKK